MSKYAVSYINFFDNKLKMGVVEADSYRQALVICLTELGNFNELDAAGWISGTPDNELGELFFEGELQAEAIEC